MDINVYNFWKITSDFRISTSGKKFMKYQCWKCIKTKKNDNIFHITDQIKVLRELFIKVSIEQGEYILLEIYIPPWKLNSASP